MKDQPEKTKTSNREKPGVAIILLGFTVFFIAIALVSLLTLHVAKNHQPTRVAVVRITKTGFVPATLSVKQGTQVIWTNSDEGLHQVAPNPYPKDTGLPGLKSEILNNAQSYEYTANAIGTFGYHDQLTPTTNGTLVVSKQ